MTTAWRTVLVFVAGILLATAPALGQGVSFENEDWEAIYYCTEMPKAPWVFSSAGKATAKIVDSAILISDLGKELNERVFVENLWNMDPRDEITVAISAKVVSCDGLAGNCIMVSNGVHEALLTLYPDKIVLEKAGITYKLDTTKTFLTYRIVTKDADIRVFANEQMVIDGTGKFTTPANMSRNLLFVGGGSSPATAEMYVKYMAFKRANEDADPGKKRGTIKVLREQILVTSEEDTNFPTARRFPDGTIIMSYSVGQHTVNERGGRIMSKDNGKTWEAPSKPTPSLTMAEIPGEGYIAVSGWRTKPIRGNVHPITVQRCTDVKTGDVKTWKAELEFPYDPGDYGLLVHRSLVRMPNGDLIGTGYGRAVNDPLPYRCYCYISHDEGKTWSYHATMITGESPGNEGFNEPVMILLRNGDLLCHIRTGGPLMQVRSKDGGKTWSKPKQIADHGVDPDLIQLSNGAVVASYGRPGVTLKVDFGGAGEKWDRTIDIYKGPGCSYTSLVEIEPGLVALFYTESGFCGGNQGFYPINRVMVAYIRIEPKR